MKLLTRADPLRILIFLRKHALEGILFGVLNYEWALVRGIIVLICSMQH